MKLYFVLPPDDKKPSVVTDVDNGKTRLATNDQLSVLTSASSSLSISETGSDIGECELSDTDDDDDYNATDNTIHV